MLRLPPCFPSPSVAAALTSGRKRSKRAKGEKQKNFAFFPAFAGKNKNFLRPLRVLLRPQSAANSDQARETGRAAVPSPPAFRSLREREKAKVASNARLFVFAANGGQPGSPPSPRLRGLDGPKMLGEGKIPQLPLAARSAALTGNFPAPVGRAALQAPPKKKPRLRAWACSRRNLPPDA